MLWAGRGRGQGQGQGQLGSVGVWGFGRRLAWRDARAAFGAGSTRKWGNNVWTTPLLTPYSPSSLFPLLSPLSFLFPYPPSEPAQDLAIAKSRRLEIRQLPSSTAADAASSSYESGSGPPFPLLLSVPINGRLTNLIPFRIPGARHTGPGGGQMKGMGDYLLLITERKQFGIISHDPTPDHAASLRTDSPYRVLTHASGPLADYGASVLGREAEAGPLAAIDPLGRCVAVHLYDGFVTILPVNSRYDPATAASPSPPPPKPGGSSSSSSSSHLLLAPFSVRIEERTVLSMSFLDSPDPAVMPQLCLLHQDARSAQHVVAHSIDLARRALVPQSDSAAASSGAGSSPRPPPPAERLRKSRVDGGSGLLVPVPPMGHFPPRVAGAGGEAVRGGDRKLPPPSSSSSSSGVLVFGQRQITYHSTADGVTRVLPIGQTIVLAVDAVPPLPPDGGDGDGDGDADLSGRYLLATEDSSIHLLTLVRSGTTGKVASLHLETLGSAPLASVVAYLGGGGEGGLVFVGSQFGDSALVRILDEPVPIVAAGAGAAAGAAAGGADRPGALAATTYLSPVEEYTNLGPIVDFDLIPTAHSSSNSSPSGAGRQSMVVTASGLGASGTVRLVRSGIGLTEGASIHLPGIKGMWNLRERFGDLGDDRYLVQSFVGETRVLGVVMEEEDDEDDEESMGEEGAGQEDADMSQDASRDENEDDGAAATLDEVFLPGFDPTRSTLFAGNVHSKLMESLAVQVTDSEVRLVDLSAEDGAPPIDVYRTDSEGDITLATGNEAGQIILALRGGSLVYLSVAASDGSAKIERVAETVLEREISCLDVRAFDSSSAEGGLMSDLNGEASSMELDAAAKGKLITAERSELVAVGLWDDFSVRLLSLGAKEKILGEVLRINLGSEPESDDVGDGAMDTGEDTAVAGGTGRGQHMMARSLCMVTLDPGSQNQAGRRQTQQPRGIDVLLVGLGDGGLLSFAVSRKTGADSVKKYNVYARKEVSIGSRAVGLVPFRSSSSLLPPVDSSNGPEGIASPNSGGGTCVLATGDRPTVVYLAGGSGGGSTSTLPKLCYSAVHLSSEPSGAGGNEGEGSGTAGSIRAGRESLAVAVAAPFHSNHLFSSPPAEGPGKDAQQVSSATYPLCVSDESTLRLGIIDDIQKLHVTTHNIGMSPRRVAYHEAGRVVCVGAIDAGAAGGPANGMMEGESNMGNCVRFFDDTTFQEVDRMDLDPFEMIMSMISTNLKIKDAATLEKSAGDEKESEGDIYRPYLLIGTAYAFPDEDEATRGRVLVVQCGGVSTGIDTSMSDASAMPSSLNRTVRVITEMATKGSVYSMTPFYDGSILVSINSKTHVCRLFDSSGDGGSIVPTLKSVGAGHHGHIASLCVRSLAHPHALSMSGSGPSTAKERERSCIALVGDLMRSLSIVQFYPEYDTLEEVARDYNANWTTAVEMLTDDVYLGAENWNNLFVLKRNSNAASEEVRCRLDTVGEFNFGEMPNKFLTGSLVVSTGAQSSVDGVAASSGNRLVGGSPAGRTPKKAKKNVVSPGGGASRPMKAVVTTGSQTLFVTVDGSVGSVLGIDIFTAAFFSTLERCMARVIRPVGGLGHSEFHAFVAEQRHHPSRGFVDGDFVESFLDLDRATMERVLVEMNEDGRWEIEDFADESVPPGNDGKMDDRENSTILTVEDVIGMVEEMSMLH